MMLILKVKSEQGSLGKNSGCREAPDAILNKLNERDVKSKFESAEIPVFPNDIIATDESIYKNAKKMLSRKPIFIGGDHSITYSIFKAFSENYGKENSALIVFDAHADAIQIFKPVSHEDMNRVLIEENILRRENLLIIGLRKLWEQEAEWLREKKINVIRAHEIRKNTKNAIAKLVEFLRNSKIKNVYLSIDVDVFDPGAMPATGYLEENGLNEKQFLEMLDVVLKSEKIKAVDFVEYNPVNDIDEKGLKLVVRILNAIVHK